MGNDQSPRKLASTMIYRATINKKHAKMFPSSLVVNLISKDRQKNRIGKRKNNRKIFLFVSGIRIFNRVQIPLEYSRKRMLM